MEALKHNHVFTLFLGVFAGRILDPMSTTDSLIETVIYFAFLILLVCYVRWRSWKLLSCAFIAMFIPIIFELISPAGMVRMDNWLLNLGSLGRVWLKSVLLFVFMIFMLLAMFVKKKDKPQTKEVRDGS